MLLKNGNMQKHKVQAQRRLSNLQDKLNRASGAHSVSKATQTNSIDNRTKQINDYRYGSIAHNRFSLPGDKFPGYWKRQSVPEQVDQYGLKEGHALYNYQMGNENTYKRQLNLQSNKPHRKQNNYQQQYLKIMQEQYIDKQASRLPLQKVKKLHNYKNSYGLIKPNNTQGQGQGKPMRHKQILPSSMYINEKGYDFKQSSVNEQNAEQYHWNTTNLSKGKNISNMGYSNSKNRLEYQLRDVDLNKMNNAKTLKQNISKQSCKSYLIYDIADAKKQNKNISYLNTSEPSQIDKKQASKESIKNTHQYANFTKQACTVDTKKQPMKCQVLTSNLGMVEQISQNPYLFSAPSRDFQVKVRKSNFNHFQKNVIEGNKNQYNFEEVVKMVKQNKQKSGQKQNDEPGKNSCNKKQEEQQTKTQIRKKPNIIKQNLQKQAIKQRMLLQPKQFKLTPLGQRLVVSQEQKNQFWQQFKQRICLAQAEYVEAGHRNNKYEHEHLIGVHELQRKIRDNVIQKVYAQSNGIYYK